MTQPGTPKVRTIQIPFRVLVVRADPDYEIARRREPFYKWSNGREFNQNTSQFGAYKNPAPLVMTRQGGSRAPLLRENGSPIVREQ